MHLKVKTKKLKDKVDTVSQENTMGDSIDMTVEFLRARLLSERSVSRAARQRADQLARRVVELEEQLRIVTIQRKKAEKAAAEVLAILEAQGIGDLSEAIDSSSDGEVPSDVTQKEYESSTASRLERSEVEDGSGSEPEASPSLGRSLSWRSHSNRPHSRDKQSTKQINQRQRRHSFGTTSQSSSKHQLGKSCRKIKRKDAGSATDSDRCNPTHLDLQGTVTGSINHNNGPEASLETSMGVEGEAAVTSRTLLVDDLNRQTEVQPGTHGSGRDEEMQRVLEEQAKLIGQFQAEENAQREWEQKYNEKMISTLANHESHNLLEQSSKSKEEVSEPADRIRGNNEGPTQRAVHSSSNEEPTAHKNAKSKEATHMDLPGGSVHQVTTANSNGWHSHTAGTDLVGQQCDSMGIKESSSHDFTASNPSSHDKTGKAKQTEAVQAPNGYPNNSGSHQQKVEGTSPQTGLPMDNHGKHLNTGPLLKLQLHQQLSKTPTSSSSKSSVGGVLESLRRARLSLSHELKRTPSPNQGTLALTTAPNPQTRTAAFVDDLNIPVGPGSLFRLPSDTYHSVRFAGPRYYGSGFSLPSNQADAAFTTGSYGYQNPAPTSYTEAGFRGVPGRGNIDNYFVSSMGTPDASRFSRASSDLSAERASFRSEFSPSYSDGRTGNHRTPPSDTYGSFGGDRTRGDRRMP